MKAFLALVLIMVFALFYLTNIATKEKNKVATEEQYNVVTKADGTTYTFDKKTGEIVKADTDSMQQRPSPAAETGIKKPELAAIPAVIQQPDTTAKKPGIEDGTKTSEPVAVAADLPEISIPGKRVKMRLKTNWLAGRLNYIFQVYPYESFSKFFSGQGRNPAYVNQPFGFEIVLADDHADLVHKIVVDFWSMKPEMDKQGKKMLLSASSYIDCTAEEFERLAFYSVTCGLDLDVIPSISFEEEMKDNIAQMPERYGFFTRGKNNQSAAAGKYWIDSGDGVKHYFSSRGELDNIFSGLEN